METVGVGEDTEIVFEDGTAETRVPVIGGAQPAASKTFGRKRAVEV